MGMGSHIRCVCTMDGAKNVTNEQGDSGSKIQVDYIMVEKGATCSHAIGSGSIAISILTGTIWQICFDGYGLVQGLYVQ